METGVVGMSQYEIVDKLGEGECRGRRNVTGTVAELRLLFCILKAHSHLSTKRLTRTTTCTITTCGRANCLALLPRIALEQVYQSSVSRHPTWLSRESTSRAHRQES
jgi:hypothetical protein